MKLDTGLLDIADFDTIKRVGASEFQELGYLQELNRRFLHPLGLALAIVIDADDNKSFGEVLDYREEKDGPYYDAANYEPKKRTVFNAKKSFIDEEFKRRNKDRKELLDFEVEMDDTSTQLSNVTRFEVINHARNNKPIGRVFTDYDVKNIELSFQDNDRTLKVFISDKK